MLYFFYGNDREALIAEARSAVDHAMAEDATAATVRFDDDGLTPGELEELVFGERLFGGRSIVVLDGVLQRKEVKDFILSNLKHIEATEDFFIFIEEKLDAPSVAKVKKFTKNVFVFKKAKEKKKDEFSVFSLADGLGERNKKKLWVALIRARMAGIAPEEIHGVLFWQVKSMLLARGASSAQEVGLNPFVFGKAKRFVRNFTKDELENISTQLVDLYHSARRGGMELDTAIERFALTL